MYSVGRCTAVKTSVIVTSPASGIPAAPTEAITEVSSTSTCCVSVRSAPIICATKSALIDS